jgi:DNA replication protein DnaC
VSTADNEGARANAAGAVALVDRLTHHAEIITIEGESYRKRRS